MKFIIKILENYWSKELKIAYEHMKRFHTMYLKQKRIVETSRKPSPIWLGINSNWDDMKIQSEICHNEYLYWKKRFKKIKAKLNKLHQKA